MIYTSLLVESKGMDFISVFIHKNSPQTQVILTQTKLSNHQEKRIGKHPLYIQQAKR